MCYLGMEEIKREENLILMKKLEQERATFHNAIHSKVQHLQGKHTTHTQEKRWRMGRNGTLS
jgi:hypothetical protein